MHKDSKSNNNLIKTSANTFYWLFQALFYHRWFVWAVFIYEKAILFITDKRYIFMATERTGSILH